MIKTVGCVDFGTFASKPKNSTKMSYENCVQFLTQLTLGLRDLLEGRSHMGRLGLKEVTKDNCYCSEANFILNQINTLRPMFDRALESNSEDALVQLRNGLQDFQNQMESSTSIQITDRNQSLVDQSSIILSKISDPNQYLHELFTSLVAFIVRLMRLNSCPAHSNNNDLTRFGIMEDDDEESLRSGVASLLSEDSPMKDINKNEERNAASMSPEGITTGSCRKRKQHLMPRLASAPCLPSLSGSQMIHLRPRRTPPTSPTSLASPNKRPRCLLRPPSNTSTSTSSSFNTMSAPTLSQSPALELLETKKKGQRSGLYQWVLWREALKGEKDRRTASTPNPSSTPPSHVNYAAQERTSWRRLSFS